MLDIMVAQRGRDADQVAIWLSSCVAEILRKVERGYWADKREHLYRANRIPQYAQLKLRKTQPVHNCGCAENCVYFLAVTESRKCSRPTLSSRIADLRSGLPVAETQ